MRHFVISRRAREPETHLLGGVAHGRGGGGGRLDPARVLGRDPGRGRRVHVVAGPEAAAAALGSPGKRRRREDPVEAAANDSGGAAASVEEVANAAGAGDDDASARETAASMTVAQLKHELQVMGLAHLYVGKRGVKKADLVDMFVNRGES